MNPMGTLSRLPAAWRTGSTPTLHVPGYDRSRVTPGIAHIGVGNFHRVHMASYTDELIARGGHDQWGILGIGLTAEDQARAAAYAQQDRLYTVTTTSTRRTAARMVGAMVEYAYGPDDPAGLIDRLADSAIRIVSLTITEGGYNLDEATGAFRTDAPEVIADLGRPNPATAFGVIAAALARRRAAGDPPFTVLSCDNLRSNGDTARKAVVGYAELVDPALARWIEDTVAFPNSMVDRIAPRVDDDMAAALNHASGVADAVPALAEEFRQWVLQDHFPSGRPDWAAVGVQLREDVEAYEGLKARLLNASHSLLAYPGLLLGLRHVHEAVAEHDLTRLLERFMTTDAAPLITPPQDESVPDYICRILDRFANPAIRDSTERIASDGAAKLPVFHRATAEGLLATGGDLRRIALLVATYRAYLGGRDEAGRPFTVQEPHLAETDWRLLRSADPLDALAAGPFAPWGLRERPTFVRPYLEIIRHLTGEGVRCALAYAVADGRGF